MKFFTSHIRPLGFLKRSALQVAVLSLAASPAAAEHSTLRIDDQLNPQGILLNDASGANTFTFGAFYDRSYCCYASLQDNSQEGVLFQCEGPDPVRGSQEVLWDYGVEREDVDLAEREDARQCFITAPNNSDVGGVYRLGIFAVQPESEPQSALPARIACSDTTLLGGFNTMANEINYLSLTADVPNDGLTAIVVGYAANGSVLFRSHVDLSGNERRDIDIHSLVGGPAYGKLLVLHNGRPGALHAVMSEYQQVESRLVLRAREALKPARN